MKTPLNLLFGLLLALSLTAADAKDDVRGAAKKLADAEGYSWRTTTDMGGGGSGGNANRMRPGPAEGKTTKDGTICLSMTRGDNTIEAFVKGQKGAYKTQDGWQSLEEADADAGGGQQNPGRFMGRMLRNYKAPAAQITDLLAQTKDLKKDGDAYSGELTEEGVKSLMTFGGRQGANAAEVSGGKGTLKVWLKDGTIAKYEFHVEGKVTFNNNERDVNRTTTVEIKEVGSTKITIPDEAKKKMS